MTHLDSGISESLNVFGRTGLSFPNISFLNMYLSALYRFFSFSTHTHIHAYREEGKSYSYISKIRGNKMVTVQNVSRKKKVSDLTYH